jgi:hypothetical protein
MAQARKTATRPARKPAVKRKPVAKRSVPKKPAADLTANAQDASRNIYLAGLGFYGKAFDQAQEQLGSLQKRLEQRRKNADKLYKELVKRGEKLEKDAKVAIKEIELPKLELESLTDRKKLEQQLKKAKARFNELKKSVQFKAAA